VAGIALRPGDPERVGGYRIERRLGEGDLETRSAGQPFVRVGLHHEIPRLAERPGHHRASL